MKNREALGWLIAAALFVAVAAAYWPRGEPISGAARVIDGDGLHVGSTEVRLHAVDAFEGKCARATKAHGTAAKRPPISYAH